MSMFCTVCWILNKRKQKLQIACYNEIESTFGIPNFANYNDWCRHSWKCFTQKHTPGRRNIRWKRSFGSIKMALKSWTDCFFNGYTHTLSQSTRQLHSRKGPPAKYSTRVRLQLRFLGSRGRQNRVSYKTRNLTTFYKNEYHWRWECYRARELLSRSLLQDLQECFQV